MATTVKFDHDGARKLLLMAMGAGVAGGTIKAQAIVKNLVNRKGTGIHWPGQSYRSSSPNRPPTKQTGQYGRSIQVDLSDLKTKNPRGRVGTNDKRGPWLEYGTRHMAPRPHFRLLFNKKNKSAIRNVAVRLFEKKFRTLAKNTK